MAFLNENEWIRLNEIAYNISFIYTVEEMQHEILNRWLPFLISYDPFFRNTAFSIRREVPVNPC